MENTLLSNHFKLGEFLNLGKYSDNIPTMQHVVNMTYFSQKPWDYCLRRMNSRRSSRATMPKVRDSSALLVKPATRNVKNDTVAAVKA